MGSTIAPQPRLEAPSAPRKAAADCIHCGLPVPRERRRRGDHFCCDGCLRVHDLIRGADLGRFYDLRRGAIAPPAELRPDSFAWLDRLAPPTGPDEDADAPRQLTLDVQGVHCAACVWLLQELHGRQPGAVDLQINPALGTARVTWVPSQGDLRRFLQEAEPFGYRFGPPRKDAPRQSRSLLLRLGVCAAVAMNAMIFSLSFYFGLAPRDGALYSLFGTLNLALGTIAVAVGGPVFFRGAWQSLRRRLAHLDLPISLGIALAYAGSVVAHFTRGPQAAYFDSLTLFVTLMLLGRWLQERVLERNRRSLLAADGIAGLSTRRAREGRLESIAATAIERGDELWIVPGDLVPVDGFVLGKAARVSLDWIDGESRPRTVEAGGTVRAGSFNADDAPLRLGAAQDFADSRLVELLTADPDRAERTSGRWWHRVSTIYVAAVLTFAAAAFAVWIPAGLDRALAVTVSVLVVTCPCALGLATPLAHEMTLASLRRRGVFIRRGTFVDRALSVRKILFDKTGTLTLGRIALTEEAKQRLAGLDPESTTVLANLAARSNHPVSRAIARALPAPALSGADNPTREIPGQGLEWVRPDGCWRLGSRRFAAPGAGADAADAASPDAGAPRDDADAAAETVLSRDGRPLVALPYAEELRDDAREEVDALRRAGFDIHLLSGDTGDRVRTAAAALRIDADHASGGLSPEAKAARVAALDNEDTLMVGDGLNDGPSFREAWTSATPAIDHASLPARADFYFLGGGIGAIRRALAHARRLRTVVRDNLILATVYNVAALVLCFAGLVTPVVAAVLMPLSSAGVVSLTAARLSKESDPWK